MQIFVAAAATLALLLADSIHAASVKPAESNDDFGLPVAPSRRVTFNGGSALNFQPGSAPALVNAEQDGVSVRSVTEDGSQLLVSAPGAPWMRLDLVMTRIPVGAHIKIVSSFDGHAQFLDARTIEQWQYTSAYFNGDNVTVIYSGGSDGPWTLSVSGVEVGERVGNAPRTSSICSISDQRKQSFDSRSARMMPIGCTAWLINDEHNCMLSAGHCARDSDAASKSVLQFQVPFSFFDGTVQHPSPDHQYIVDPASFQTDGHRGRRGDDWFYLGTFPNSNTGLTAVGMQRDTYNVSTYHVLPPANAIVEVTGYGVSSGYTADLSQVQQTHRGPMIGVEIDPPSIVLAYHVDTMGGNSGSPIVDTRNGMAVGIHTNGGCTYQRDQTFGFNYGTSTVNPRLMRALANPKGVCKTGPK